MFGQVKSVLQLVLVCALCFALAVSAENRQWNAGVGLWGKRSVGGAGPMASLDDEQRAQLLRAARNSRWEKRAAQWHAANGLWGKRSDPNAPPAYVGALDGF